MEQRLSFAANEVEQGQGEYPIALPYCIAETEKGFGFPGAGTNDAHGLPLGNNPKHEHNARELFNQGAAALFQSREDSQVAITRLMQTQQPQAQPADIIVTRPEPGWLNKGDIESANAAMDQYFCELADLNPELRIRLGNPDELSSNRFAQSLQRLKHRVTQPEPGVFESVTGSVITALNEEAVVCACLANKAGLNLVVSYEAFAIKMLGALRQAIIFSRHQKEYAEPANWLSLPIISTSHLWENGKNEQSHQDPALAEALNNEMSDVARVVYPADANSALATLKSCYADYGAVWNIISAKSKLPVVFSAEQAKQLVEQGALCLRGHCESEIQLVATGAYQLQQALLLSDRLLEKDQAHSVIYLYEPGRFRVARDQWEAEIIVDDAQRSVLFPAHIKQRLFFCHGHGDNQLSVCRSLDLGPDRTLTLGYINQGGTLDSDGMLFANKSTWAHGAYQLSQRLAVAPDNWLNEEELQAVLATGSPYAIIAEPFS